MLSRTEEMIMLAICQLKENAYGVTIRTYLNEVTGQHFSVGGIYVPLDRLVRKGFLHYRQGEPTPERGGMSKRFFELTAKGQHALAETKAIQDKLWEGLSGFSLA